MLCMAISRDGATLAAGCDDGCVRLWRITKVEGRPRIDENTSGEWKADANRVRSLTFTENGRLITCGDDGTVKVWAPPGQIGIDRIGPAGVRVSRIAVSRDGENIACIDSSSSAILHKRGSHDTTWRHLPTVEHDDWLQNITMTGNGKLLAAATKAGKIILFDLQ